MNASLPAQPGTYILCLQLNHSSLIQIGKLGCFDFHRGFYFYVGSAFGPGGLRARCSHHIKISTRPRWHIDYLRQHSVLKHILYSTHTEHLEHQWAGHMDTIKETTSPITGFGSSDCNCKSHLFYSHLDTTDNLLNNTENDFSSLKLLEID